MKYLLLCFCIFPSVLLAEPPVIVEVVEDKKASVYVPPGVNLKPGDTLYKEKPEEELIKIEAINQPNMDEDESDLRPRDHNIKFDVTKSKTELDLNSLEVDGEVDSMGVEASYMRNFGYLQPGVQISYSKSDSETEKTKVREIAAILRVNIIENKVGNDIIPFVGVGAGNVEIDYKDTDGNDYLLKGEYFGYGAGLTWYPFNELVGVEVTWQQIEGDLGYSGKPDFDGDISIKVTQLNFGYVISF